MSVDLKKIFKEKIISNEMKIYCDGIAWNEYNSPSVCKELLFQNPNGKVYLKSFYQIENKDILNLVKIDYLSVEFSPMINQIDKFSFNQPEIKIEFITNDDFTEKFNEIKEKFDLDISYPQKHKVIIVLNEYKDINLLKNCGINEDNEMEIKEYKHKLFAIDENEQMLKDDDIEIDENEEKKEEPQLTIESDFIHFDSNDVEKEFNDFYNSIEGLININEIPKTDEDLRKNELYSFAHKISLNYNNNFCQIIPKCSINYNNKNNFNFMIKEYNLMINQDLIYLDNTELVEEYKNITIYNYLNIYRSLLATLNKGNENINYINFFANLLSKYLGDLENKKQEINKKLVSIHKNTSQMYNPLNNFALRLSYEIQTLKLLYILFLDCYKITIEQKTEIQNEDRNNFLNEQININKMRKKKIIEWLIETIKELYERRKKNDNNKLKQLILAITSGQLQDAISISQNMNMPMLALLISQTNNKNKQSYMAKIMNYLYASQLKMKEEVKKIYNLFGNVENCIIAAEDLTWYQYFIQILLFSSDPKETLNNEIKELDNILRQNGLLPNDKNDFSEINDINYCLLMLFQSFEDVNKESNVSTQLYKCISSCVFKLKCMENCKHKNHNSDHHLLFIISDILFKLLKSDTFNNNMKQSKSSKGSNCDESMEGDITDNKFKAYDIKTLSKLNQMMLNKVLQEMMISKTNNFNYIPHIFNLINFSSYNECAKTLIKKETINKLGYDISQIKDIDMFFQSNNCGNEFKIDQSIKSYALGLYNKSIFNYNDSIKYFENSGDFGMILDTFTMENISLFVENQGKFKFTDEFLNKYREMIMKYKGENYINGISSMFYKFCRYMNDINNCDLKNLNDLLDKVIDISSQEKIIKLAKGYMIEYIREMINLKLKLDNYKCSGSSDRLLLPLPSMKILGNPNVRFGYKKMEIQNGIDAAIMIKSEKYKI